MAAWQRTQCDARRMMRAWGHGNCTSAPPPYNRTPTRSCEQERWLEKFVNEVCDHSGPAVLEQMRNDTAPAPRHYEALARASATEASIRVCLADTNTTCLERRWWCILCLRERADEQDRVVEEDCHRGCVPCCGALLFVAKFIGARSSQRCECSREHDPHSKKITV